MRFKSLREFSPVQASSRRLLLFGKGQATGIGIIVPALAASPARVGWAGNWW